jgi:hypothetical protein
MTKIAGSGSESGSTPECHGSASLICRYTFGALVDLLAHETRLALFKDAFAGMSDLDPKLKTLQKQQTKHSNLALKREFLLLKPDLKLVQLLLGVLGRLAPVGGPAPPELRLLGSRGELRHLLLFHS